MSERQSDSERTNAGQGTTGLDTGRIGTAAADHQIPDPDYGVDPKVASPMYGGAGRGSDDTVAQASMDRTTLEGDRLPDTADDNMTGGTARAGEMTSTADTFDNTRHGLGESGMRGNQDQMVDPNDEGTFEEVIQLAERRRA